MSIQNISRPEAGSFAWRDSIIAKSQLKSEVEINDWVALTGVKLALAGDLPLDLKTMVLLGVCALNRLPATPVQQSNVIPIRKEDSECPATTTK